MNSSSSARYYLRVLMILSAALAASWISLSLRTDTSWIAPVSEGDAALSCGREIVPLTLKSISAYYAGSSGDEDLQTQICAFDAAFDGSTSDRAHLVNFSLKVLEFPWPGRYDIAQHFYRKVIAANPNDALAEYLKLYKLDAK
ncbi:MAG: hypothetical protein KA099_03065 [Alphaproteobacteria bacterium]|nr:hypothetical protein [Alphaproteobacteria bacterium]MBP7759323.1 hypothetical protein [Alphaproteobacteria bacterium]MBP7762536.1 hypothetical protein [Alphaproteobacteria bacterium]MBP7904283.1 hypothetical protein [Alphaproteobacteria bacterium]